MPADTGEVSDPHRTRKTAPAPARARLLPAASLMLLAALLATALAGSNATAASSTTVVSVTIPSATSLATTGCGSGAYAVMDLGVVQPSASATIGGCQLTWGSSNNTSQLRIAQRDTFGATMHRPALGAYDLNWDGDTTTGNGTVVTDVAGANATNELAVQADGKVVAAGYATNADEDSTLIRYTTTGMLDTTFDGPGVAGNGAFSLNLGGNDRFYDVTLRADGGIVAAGGTSSDSTIAVLNPTTGAWDTTFNAGAGARVDDLGGTDKFFTVGIQSDGRIVAAGSAGTNALVARYLPSGALDTSFAGTGSTTFSWGAGNSQIWGMAIQPDGAIVVVGRNSSDFALARLLTDGTLDASFDGPGAPGNGKFVTSLTAGTDNPDDVVVQPDGKIIALGTANVGATGDVGLLRLNGVDGSLDTTWDGPGGSGNGIVTFDLAGQDDLDHLVLQPDGRTVAVGASGAAGGSQNVAIARVDPTGALDASFDGPGAAGNGRVTIDIAGADDNANAVALGPDGSVLVAGFTTNANADSVVIAFNGTTVHDFQAGTWDWTSGASGDNTFGVCITASANLTYQGAWSVDGDGDCADGNADPWAAVPAAFSTVATAATTVTNATTTFTFGLRAAGDQPPGSYVAPIAFEVLAP